MVEYGVINELITLLNMVQVIKYNLNTSQIICIYNICKNQQTINSNNTVQLYIFKKKINGNKRQNGKREE